MPQKRSLTSAALQPSRAALTRAHKKLRAAFPGDRSDRQPVHVVYGGAHLFKPDTARKLGDLALKSLETYAPDSGTLARALNLPEEGGLSRTLYGRVVEKLRHEPVEDLRVDFEDGYGHRTDDEEDGHAVSVAEAMAQGLRQGSLPPFIGIRVKAFTPELFDRSTRTLDLFLTSLLKATRGELPPNFTVTLPKVSLPEEVAALAKLLGALERRHKLKPGIISVELMVETPQALVGLDGRAALPSLVKAGAGRVTGAHFGAYDYTAALNITAPHQKIESAAADFARQLMQVTLAGSGVRLSDGATNVMPVGPHRADKDHPLTREHEEQNREVVHAAWRLSYRHIRHSLANGLYQGWDLHPAQLPVRYAAVYAFFLEGLQPVAARLRAFVDKAAQATLSGDIFDDAATGQGLLNFFLRGIACGALTDADAVATGLKVEELRTRSFLRIVEGRRKAR